MRVDMCVRVWQGRRALQTQQHILLELKDFGTLPNDDRTLPGRISQLCLQQVVLCASKELASLSNALQLGIEDGTHRAGIVSCAAHQGNVYLPHRNTYLHCMHIYIDTCTHACMHATHAYTYTRIYASMHTCQCIDTIGCYLERNPNHQCVRRKDSLFTDTCMHMSCACTKCLVCLHNIHM